MVVCVFTTTTSSVQAEGTMNDQFIVMEHGPGTHREEAVNNWVRAASRMLIRDNLTPGSASVTELQARGARNVRVYAVQFTKICRR